MAFKFRYLLLCLAIFVSNAIPVYAQEAPPPPRDNIPPPPGLQLPIDDHIWILLLMGLLLGVYFLIKKKITISTP